MKRDVKYIIKRVIIGILIGLFFIMFKSCNVNASAITTGTTTMYSQTQNCDLNSNNDLICTQGLAYKFVYSNGATNVLDIDMPFFIPNEHNILVSNLIYDVDLGGSITINSTNRHIYLGFPTVSQFYRTGTGSTNLKFAPDMFPRFPKVNDETNHNYRLSSVLGFKPYYCSFFNVNTNQIETCNLKYDIATSSNIFSVALDLPLGTVLNHLTISFGTNQLYTGSTKELCGLRVPNSDTFYNNDCSSTSPYDKYVQTSYNQWRQSNLSSIGLFYFVKGAIFETPKFYLPNYQYFVSTTSSNFSGNSYGASFTGLSSSQKELLNSQVEQIEQQIYDQENTPSNESFFDSFYEGFTTSSNASGFISLFNNMFLYPLQKLRTNASIDLVRDNINGDKILNNHLCMKNSQGGLLGAYNPYQVQFYRDYKFNLPCPHTEIYNKLYYGEFGFYGNDFKGASIHSGINYSFVDLWLTIQHGFLVYLLFVNCLNIYKYVLDSKKTEIEVLEL